MKIVIKTEDGRLFFDPYAIELEELADDEGNASIVLRMPYGMETITDPHDPGTLVSVVNEIYRVLDETVVRNCFCFDIKALIEEFQDQEE